MKCGEQRALSLGCLRRFGHKGFCTKTPEVAEHHDEHDRLIEEEERRRHPVTSFADITTCPNCHALVLDKDLELHEDSHR